MQSSGDSFSIQGIELHFATNCLSHFLLTDLLLPQLKASPRETYPRVINTSSVSHYFPTSKQGLDLESLEKTEATGSSVSPMQRYGQSKLVCSNLRSLSLFCNKLTGSAIPPAGRHYVLQRAPTSPSWCNKHSRQPRDDQHAYLPPSDIFQATRLQHGELATRNWCDQPLVCGDRPQGISGRQVRRSLGEGQDGFEPCSGTFAVSPSDSFGRSKG